MNAIQQSDPFAAAAVPAKTGKKKSEVPDAILPDHLLPLTAGLFELKQLAKDLEGQIKMLEADLYPALNSLRIEKCREVTKYSGSVRFGTFLFMCQRPWQTKIPVEQEGELNRIFGDARPQYFKRQYEIKIDADQLTPEQKQGLLNLGLKPEVHLAATDKLMQDITMLPAVADLAAQAGFKPTMFVKES